MRVKLKTKNKGVRVETYPCRKCQDPIKAGDKYFEWKHRHAPFSRQHATHGAPKQSELCSGKMSGVYAANEALEEVISTGNPDELASALESAAESVREVANEYEENRNNMPESLQNGNGGSDMEEKANALNEYADALEEAASDDAITNWDMDEESPEPGEDHTDACASNLQGDRDCDCGFDELEAKKAEWEQESEDKIAAAIDRAQEALDSFSL